LAGFELDDTVESFVLGIGDLGQEERFDLRPPVLDRLGEGDQLGQVGVVGAPGGAS
jgi:hypothetical protein